MIINVFFPNPAAHELLVDKLFCSTYLWLGLDNDFLHNNNNKKKVNIIQSTRSPLFFFTAGECGWRKPVSHQGSPFLHVATGVEISRAPGQEVFVALEKEIQTGVSPPRFSKSPLL